VKFGVKIYKKEAFLEHFKNQSDFFEIQALQKVNYNFLKKFKQPIVIHAEHQGFGINIANKSKQAKNLKAINFARKLADKTNAKKIIVHPGLIENKNCSEEQSVKLLNKIKDKRIIVESMPLKNNRLCTTPEQTKEFLKKTKTGLCLDLNHSIIAAIRLNKDYIKFLKQFIKLKPKHYHLGGQIIKNKEDHSHKSFKDSNIPLKKILSILPKSAQVTLEVTTDIEDTEYDLELVKSLTE